MPHLWSGARNQSHETARGQRSGPANPGTGGPGAPLMDRPLRKSVSPSATSDNAQPPSQCKQQPGFRWEGAPLCRGITPPDTWTPPVKTRRKGAQKEGALAKPTGPCLSHPYLMFIRAAPTDGGLPAPGSSRCPLIHRTPPSHPPPPSPTPIPPSRTPAAPRQLLRPFLLATARSPGLSPLLKGLP